MEYASEAFPIAVYRPSSLISRGAEALWGLQLNSSNRGYPCSRRSLTECMDKMTVPSWREPKSRPLWMEAAELDWSRVRDACHHLDSPARWPGPEQRR